MQGCKKIALFGLILILMLPLLPPATAQTAESVPAYDLDPQPAVDWMKLTYDVVLLESINAPQASRVYAYMGITLYEAILNGLFDNYSLANSIDSMPDMPLPAPDETYDWLTVANIALAEVLESFIPKNSTTASQTRQMIADLREVQLINRGEAVDASTIESSTAYGEEIAQAMLGWIAADGFAETRTMEYELPTGYPSYWVLTTPDTKPAEPFWGQLRPFTLEYADECMVPLNLVFDTAPESAFYQQALEVKEAVNEVTPDQEATVYHWIDTPGLTGAPAGHWVMIENQLVTQLNLTLDRAAEMYAMVGMALGDSFISAWSAKYQILLLRPVTYINTYIRRSWGPLVETPPFPEYPSGHSVTSAAAAGVLTDLFGIVAFTDETHISRGLPPRFYTSFNAAAEEAAMSRMYGGIHYRVAIENGLEQGRCISDRIADEVRLNPFRQGE